MEKYRKKAVLYLVTASILWSIGGLFIKLVTWNPIAIAGARSGIAAIVMLLYLKKPVIHLGKTKLLGACTYSSLLIFFVMLGMVIFLKLIKDGSPVEMTFLGNIITFIIAIPFYFQSVPNINSILGLLILGIFQLGISYIFYTLAIKYVSPIEAIIIPVLEPLLNPFWVFLFTGETPGTYVFIGGAIVLMAISIRELFVKK